MEVAFFYVDAGAAAYAAFRVAAEFAAILAVRHYSNALDAYMYVAVAGRAGVGADTGDVSGCHGGGRDSIYL